MPRPWAFDAIGTSWEIVTDVPVPEYARREVAAVIEQFDRAWSRFRADSAVAAIAAGAPSAIATDDAGAMLAAFDELGAATSGAVNPMIGASLERLGYDASISLHPSGDPLAAPDDWRSRLTSVGAELRLDVPGGVSTGAIDGCTNSNRTIDIGALGKGRLVDLVLPIVVAACPGDVLVDASGDMAARGGAVRVGLEHPRDPRKAIGVIELRDQSLAASASNRRAWGDGLHHVLDARTGMPVRSVIATWAVAPVGMESGAMHADAIATALFFDGGADLAHRWGVRWVRMLSDGRAETSPDCPAELFTAADIVGP